MRTEPERRKLKAAERSAITARVLEIRGERSGRAGICFAMGMRTEWLEVEWRAMQTAPLQSPLEESSNTIRDSINTCSHTTDVMTKAAANNASPRHPRAVLA